MSIRTKSLLGAAAAVAVLGAAGAAVAGAAGDDDAGDRPITGAALDRASAAALAQTGGGRVTETEAGDEEGAYEVEVTLGDGREVDVHLDASFNVLDQEPDAGGDAGERGR